MKLPAITALRIASEATAKACEAVELAVTRYQGDAPAWALPSLGTIAPRQVQALAARVVELRAAVKQVGK